MTNLDDEDDIGADVRAAIEGGTTADVAPVEAPTVDPAASVEEPSEGRERGPDGKFIAKPAEVVQPATVQPPQAGTEPSQEAIRPPVSWSATAKADFAQLPPHIQQEVLKREKDIEAGMAQWNPKGERLNKFEALFAPRKEKFALAGIDEFGAIQRLLAAQDYLERSPAEAIAYLAAQYNVALPGMQQAQPQGPQVDPQVANLQARLDAFERQRQAETQERETAATQSAVSEWEAFRSDPANPYAENVRQEMHALLRAGHVQTLKDAYDRAVWANPETRSLLQKQVSAPVVPKVTQPAGLGVIGAPGLGGQPANQGDPNASVEDDVRAAIASIRGRA